MAKKPRSIIAINVLQLSRNLVEGTIRNFIIICFAWASYFLEIQNLLVSSSSGHKQTRYCPFTGKSKIGTLLIRSVLKSQCLRLKIAMGLPHKSGKYSIKAFRPCLFGNVWVEDKSPLISENATSWFLNMFNATEWFSNIWKCHLVLFEYLFTPTLPHPTAPPPTPPPPPFPT